MLRVQSSWFGEACGADVLVSRTGILTIIMYLNRDVPNFDTIPLRAGKQLTAMAIALAVAAVFQLFILRKPARHTLRKNIATITHGLLDYMTVFQAFVNGVQPIDGQAKASDAVLARVTRDLKKRETVIQQQLIDLMPLIKCVVRLKNCIPLTFSADSRKSSRLLSSPSTLRHIRS